MELGDRLEVNRRGPYDGGFGYGGVPYTCEMDIALALRTTWYFPAATLTLHFSFPEHSRSV
uniref:Uncharacterized protein n=1 Tax=Kalanchoe fedtschenkoi TaxID=63787 RepID=A0A7N0UAP5_KALFE